MKHNLRVMLPNGELGTVIAEYSGEGFDYTVVITDEGKRVTCHPIRLRPVPMLPDVRTRTFSHLALSPALERSPPSRFY